MDFNNFDEYHKNLWKKSIAKAQMSLIEKYYKEYNTNTSAEHPIKDGDIVRHSFEKRRV